MVASIRAIGKERGHDHPRYKHCLGVYDIAAGARSQDVAQRAGCGNAPLHDGQIAAVAVVNSCALATRNVKDFEACGLELINPFGDAGMDQRNTAESLRPGDPSPAAD
ncbi:hypothetical protein [Thiohalocapsa halophila]|uniref:hypothetical protein n=1 Tax=Thiohalocapsa halophila TaxID=69359 RepID=UPI0019085C94|nr:hypothetical protein [Thiohalocapsa halophila]